MRSSKNVDPWPIECNSHLLLQRYMMFSMYPNSRNAFEFQLKLLHKKKFNLSQISHTTNIPSKFLIVKKGQLGEKSQRCIKYSGVITLKMRQHGKLNSISTKIIRTS